ncbi:thiamine diphosphokinase [Lysinibacillus sp. LZ02]|uniref:thiamine diphosphokinase n=1 Tax=Lysinibacillus sp. LZ02 TaxID=3420668 RepID=UPI003D36E68A
MIVAICAGGPIREVAFNINVDKWIGVDRGAYYLIEQGIVPDAIVGDFDSVSEEEFVRISAVVTHVEAFQSEKDETDTDLALMRAIEFTPSEVLLTGVTGGRLDHQEAALRSLYRMQLAYPHIQFKVMNTHNELHFLTPGRHKLEKTVHPYLSFFAYGEDVCEVTLRGVKYETTNETITQATSRFTSNEILLDDAYITFSSGICLVVRSMD